MLGGETILGLRMFQKNKWIKTETIGNFLDLQEQPFMFSSCDCKR